VVKTGQVTTRWQGWRDSDLPVGQIVPDIIEALAANRPTILEAPPGSGKTTLVPLALLGSPWLQGRRIVMLEPRRLAARAAARRMAQLLGEAVGERVGYHVRLEQRVSAVTEIEIVTEGMLVQRLLGDPELSKTGLVIFDEFHERALAADQALAMTLDVKRALRPDLRLLVMSATINSAEVAEWLADTAADVNEQPYVAKAEGQLWPVETVLQARSSAAPLPRQAAEAVVRALGETSGSILVFLPGEGEIRRTAELLAEIGVPRNVEVLPLYAALSREGQDRAVAAAVAGVRKVVLATSIAESSLTIEGVRVVIDCGMMRVSRFSPRNGMSRLETLRVTRDRADQRRGRAGRLGPGVCYRLWDEADESNLADHAAAEIVAADLAPVVLQCAFWGAPRLEDLPWPTLPPLASWRQATSLLIDLGALEMGVDGVARITARGRSMVRLPTHPRLSHMVVRAADHGCARVATLLAAAITELAGESRLRGETDARALLDHVENGDAADGFSRRVERLARSWGRQWPPDSAEIAVGRMLSWAFPDRIARQRGPGGRYQMAGGGGVQIDPADPLSSQEWLVVAELSGTSAEAHIRLAAPYEQAWLYADFSGLIESMPLIEWDRQRQMVVAANRSRYGAITLRDSGLHEPDPIAVATAMLVGVKEEGLERLPWCRGALELRARVEFLRRARPEELWPDFSDSGLKASLEEWLLPILTGISRWSQMKEVDLVGALLALLGDRRRQLDTLAPTHFILPGGSRCRIRYDQGIEPIIAVRIQDIFGLEETPKVAGGRVAVVIHLLSPAQRPVQITKDLTSFWRTGYAQIRKDLRGRYPKHHWPENPMLKGER